MDTPVFVGKCRFVSIFIEILHIFVTSYNERRFVLHLFTAYAMAVTLRNEIFLLNHTGGCLP